MKSGDSRVWQASLLENIVSYQIDMRQFRGFRGTPVVKRIYFSFFTMSALPSASNRP